MALPNLSELEQKFSHAIQKASTPEQIEDVHREYLGRKGLVNHLLENLKSLPPAEKQQFGRDLNLLKQKIQDEILRKRSESEERSLNEALTRERPDWSLPSYPFLQGRTHPLRQVLDEITEIFISMGFAIAEGPEVETDRNNFDRLNIPDEHPAKDLHDTFYVEPGLTIEDAEADAKLLLRTQTSPVQVRELLKHRAAGDFPVRIVSPGKVYRHEAVDATHSSVFHQAEGLVVDRQVSFADLKGTLESFTRRFFGPEVKTRFTPSFFPFVEPGAQMEISCTICGGRKPDCPVCKGGGWLEMLGAGMVHPNVLKAAGYDPEEYMGFAFGIGIERVAMIRYGINDIRLFFENNVRFLRQF